MVKNIHNNIIYCIKIYYIKILKNGVKPYTPPFTKM